LVRRLVALLVIALAGATLYGLSANSSGISVNNSSVSSSTFRGELAAITSNPTLGCYISALDPTSFAPGAGGASMVASGAAAWANLRVEGIAIDQYAAKNLKFHPDAATLASAQASLESELSGSSASRTSSSGQPAPCPGTSAQALAEMPAEMRNFEVASQAASLDLVAKLNTTIPLTLTSVKQYYSSHASVYDTLCVSVALVDPTQVTAFNEAQAEGMSVAALANKFDPTGPKGGVYGCYPPGNANFTAVRSDTASTALNTFPKTPLYINNSGTEEALFVAPTKRTPTAFATAESTVASDIQSLNATKANTEKESILYYSAIAVDPAFGRWGLGSSGPSVFAPATPPSKVVGSTTVSALSAKSSYK
jgi:hypothetical protein